MRTEDLTPQLLLDAYRQGLFPMARNRRSPRIDWYCPDPRAVLPLDERFNIRRSLAKRIRRADLRITTDTCFAQVIRACAQPRHDDRDTWLSPPLQENYIALHELGHAHSIEAWSDHTLVGGLYGVAVGGAFCGESMFSRQPNASQVCLVHLVEHLRARGFTLLDTQFVNPHLQQFGVTEIPRDDYLAQLAQAIALNTTWQ